MTNILISLKKKCKSNREDVITSERFKIYTYPAIWTKINQITRVTRKCLEFHTLPTRSSLFLLFLPRSKCLPTFYKKERNWKLSRNLFENKFLTSFLLFKSLFSNESNLNILQKYILISYLKIWYEF